MEWTNAALSELDRILQQVRASMNPTEVDVEEVAEDIQRRIEEELAAHNTAVVSETNVRAAAAKIGVQEIVPDETHEAFKVSLEKPALRRSKFKTGLFWFVGIILPLLALGTELITHICLDSGLPDPLPTPIHALLIAVVPLFNFYAWRSSRDKKGLPLKWLGFLGGIALSTAIFNSILLSMVTPYALIGFAYIIFFGIGLLCFLPLAPLLSLFPIISSLRGIRKRQGLVPWFRKGILTGLIALVISSAPMYLTEAGLKMASSEEPARQSKGLKLLRTMGDEVLLNRACYWGATFAPDPIAWLITGGEKVRPEDAREIYYRVTGEAFNTKASPTLGFRNRRNPGGEFDWDPETGGDVVAGRLKGLSLSDSRIDGTLDADAATAYVEWTMVFKNDWKREREARAQIELPPGAVVSRLTLWIDGEEREAAFGGRSQVKQAYKKVVRKRRDPVLVTTYGPDRVLMQCYPVPANGEMKIRIGITAPLATPSETDRELILPNFLERNFRIPENVLHAVWIDDYLRDDLTDAALNAFDSIIHTESDIVSCAHPLDDRFVIQSIAKTTMPEIQKLNIVIDSSACMKNTMEVIADALATIPSTIEVGIYVADDDTQRIESSKVRNIRAIGGKDNCPALRDALLDPAVDNVVWIHGPQTWSFDACEKIRQVIERDPDKCISAYQIGHGPHRLIEKMDQLQGFKIIPVTATPAEDLAALFRSFAAGSNVWKAKRTPTDHVDPAMKKADDHLIRLYVFDQINADLSDGDSDTAEALKLALKHHLVTPVSGAVVLETQAQYKAAGLEPIDSKDAPGVPEPGAATLLIFAALLLFFGRRIYQRARFALGYYD